MKELLRKSGRAPSSDRERRAWDFGARRSDEVIERYGTSDPFEIATDAGVRIDVDEWEGMDGLVILGTYDDGRITLYRQQITTYAHEQGVEADLLREAVVAHELGHHFTDLADVQLDQSPSTACGLFRTLATNLGFRNPKPVREAVANGFTFILLDHYRSDSPICNSPEILTDLAGNDP